LNGFIRLVHESDTVLIGYPTALATGRRITLTGYGETIKIERKAGCAELYARCRIDRTGHITGEPCVLSDRPRCRDRAADGFLENGLWRGR